jgi:hypothetical protein
MVELSTTSPFTTETEAVLVIPAGVAMANGVAVAKLTGAIPALGEVAVLKFQE